MGAERDALDRALARAGSTVILRRMVDGLPRDATCLASVRSLAFREEPLGVSSEQAQDDVMLVMSPTDISGWPGAGTGPNYPQRGDFVVVRGLSRVIKVVDPIYIRDELVRIDVRIEG